MLQFLVEYGVPACSVLLMLIAGTEITSDDFRRVVRSPRSVLLGSMGQLLTLPFIALSVNVLAHPAATIMAGMLLLSLSPGGGLSNLYTYLARCNVLLSATITALGTVMALLTIPFWMQVLPALAPHAELPALPVMRIVGQLVLFMVIPMCVGFWLRLRFGEGIVQNGSRLRWASGLLLLLILVLGIWSVREDVVRLAGDILASAILFVVLAMALGWVLGYGLNADERPVLIFESGTRNIPIALILGAAVFDQGQFGAFVGFISGYLVVEIVVMVLFAMFIARRHGPPPATPILKHEKSRAVCGSLTVRWDKATLR